MVAAARGLVPVYVDCSAPNAHRDLRARYAVEGLPTVLFLDPAGGVLELLASRRPEEVRSQIRRIVEGQATSTDGQRPRRDGAGADRVALEALEAAWRDLLRQRRYDEALALVDGFIAAGRGEGAHAARLDEMRDRSIEFGATPRPRPAPPPRRAAPTWLTDWGPTAGCLVLALAILAWGFRRPRPLPAPPDADRRPGRRVPGRHGGDPQGGGARGMSTGTAVPALLGALACGGYLALAWTRPATLPPQLRPATLEFEAVYEEWDRALRAGRPDAALDVLDELVLLHDPGDHAEDLRNMRSLALSRGARGPHRAQDRPLRWQVERFAARRPTHEWALALGVPLGLVLALASLRKPAGRAPRATPVAFASGVVSPLLPPTRMLEAPSLFAGASSRASDPGGVAPSIAKLRRLQPDAGDHAHEWFAKHLQEGDSRAAVVLELSPLLVAAYSDDLDCAVVLRFPDELVQQHALERGSRLLTVNTYSAWGPRRPDLLLGPAAHRGWNNVTPLIAEFLSDDSERIELRKQAIAEDEWRRCEEAGRHLLSVRGAERARDGRPYHSGYVHGEWHSFPFHCGVPLVALFVGAALGFWLWGVPGALLAALVLGGAVFWLAAGFGQGA